MAAVKSFHFDVEAKVVITSQGVTLNVPIVLAGDFQAPDRIRGTLVVNLVFFKIESQFINIGDTSYTTDPDTGQWMVGRSPALSFVDPATLASPDFLAAGGGLANLMLVGTDTLADTPPVYQLSGRLSDDGAIGALEVSYWIGVDNGLIYQVRLGGRIALDEGIGDALRLGDIGAGAAPFDAVLTLSDFDKPVHIEAPEIASAPAGGADVPDASATTVATPPDSGWVRHEAPGHEFAVSLPPSWEIVQLAPDDVTTSLEAIRADEPVLADRISRQIELLPAAGIVKLFGFDRGTLEGETGLTSISVITQDAGFALSLDFYAGLGMQHVLALPELDGTVERTRVSLFGITAEEMRYTLDMPDQVDGGARLRVIQYLFAKGTVLWALTLATPTEGSEEYIPVLEEIAQSIEVPALAEATDADSTRGTQEQPTEETLMAKSYDSPPPMTIDATKSYTATFTMEGGGEFVVELYAAEAPVTVNNFVFLARDGYYDGVTFHRVIPGFMAQGGDPKGTGSGGPGYTFQDEFHTSLRHDRKGILSMANAGPNTNGSQFFIIFAPTLHLDGKHSVFGAVTEGMDVVDAITPRDPAGATSPGDRIQLIVIEEA